MPKPPKWADQQTPLTEVAEATIRLSGWTRAYRKGDGGIQLKPEEANGGVLKTALWAQKSWWRPHIEHPLRGELLTLEEAYAYEVRGEIPHRIATNRPRPK